MIQSQAWTRRQKYLREEQLKDWLQKLYYRQIRGSESPLPGLTGEGKRIRGLTLAPNLFLARDKHFYEVADGVAKRLTPEQVLQNYDLDTLRKLYRIAVQHPAGV